MRTTKLSHLHTLIILVLFIACGTDNQQTENTARPAKLFVVGQGKAGDFLNYPAVIQSQQHSVLSFGVSGKVTHLYASESKKVKKGAVLARLDTQDFVSKLNSARAEYKNANEQYKRASRLIEEGAVSRSELEQRKTRRATSLAQVVSAQKALQESVLIAPFSGVVAKVEIQKRQLAQAGKPAITILGKSGLEAKIDLPASIVANAKDQKKASAADTYLVLDAVPNRRIPAVFNRASLEADSTSQTYEVTFSFKPPKDFNILPGMNGIMWFRDPTRTADQREAQRIPLTAIATEGDQKYVWVVDTDSMTVSRRDIVVAADVGKLIRIKSGLKSGETIIAAGVASVTNGMKVIEWSR